MHRTNRVLIRAPLHQVFLAAADLTRWPEFLPHYRHNRFLSQSPLGGVVEMSCRQGGIPLTWVSQFQIDPERRELHFTHLRSALNATRGMEVVWRFQEQADGRVEVLITHELALAWPLVGRFVANKILGDALVQRIAEKTLAGLKRKLEARQPVVNPRPAVAEPPPKRPRRTASKAGKRAAQTPAPKKSAPGRK